MPDKPSSHFASFASFAIALPLYRVFDYAIEPIDSVGTGENINSSSGDDAPRKTRVWLSGR